jgi:hypothetical protein
MAATVPIAAAPARPVPQASPGVVFVACFLLFGVAALRVVGAVGSFYALPQVTRYYADAHGERQAGTVAGVGVILLAVLSLVVALVYALLALFDSRGMNPARILTWVAAGLTIILGALTFFVGGYDAVAWYHRLSTILTAATLAFTAAATVLLALPAAHRFYLARRHLRQQARPTFRYPPQPPPGPWYPPPLPRPVPPGPALGWPPPPGPMPLPPLRPAFPPAPPTADAPARRAPDRAVARCSSPRRPTWSSPP